MKFTVLINSFTINHVQYNRNIGIFAERLSDKNRLATFVGLLLLEVHVYLGSLRVPKKKQENKFSFKSPQPQRHVHTISHLASASSKGFFTYFFLVQGAVERLGASKKSRPGAGSE